MIRSHLDTSLFFTVVKIFLDPTVFLPQIFKLFWNNLRPYFYGYVFVYAIMLRPHGSRALAIVLATRSREGFATAKTRSCVQR